MESGKGREGRREGGRGRKEWGMDRDRCTYPTWTSIILDEIWRQYNVAEVCPARRAISQPASRA